MRYTITVVEIRENWKKEKEVGNAERNSGLKFSTIEAAEDLCKQLGIENYQIIDSTKTWSCDQVVKQSQTITDIETREKNNRDNEIKEKTARVVEINKLPLTFPFKFDYKVDGKNIKFYFARDDASFDHHRSWKISCGLSFHMEVDGKEYRDLWLDDYCSQDGKIMRKKFENEMLSRLFHWNVWDKKLKDEKQVQAVAPIVADLEEMIQKEKELRKEIS